jgi:hypothetical protein
MGLLSNELAIYDCVTGRTARTEQMPFKIGSGADCDWRIDDPSVPAEVCSIQRKGRSFYILPLNGTGEVVFDGLPGPGGEISTGEDHTLVIGRHFLALRGAGEVKKWLASLSHAHWFIFDKEAQTKAGPCPFQELGPHLRARPDGGDSAVLLCQGLTTMGFYAEHVLPHLPAPPPPTPGQTAFSPSVPTADTASIDVEYGAFTCPVCWLKFDRGDVMNIAVHASLRGDPILGEAHMQRFQATRFNDRGQAVDALGIPAPELACPHCRRKLPPGFLDAPHHIFSIVGAPSSGKSYYLSVLVKTLQTTLFQQFGVVFRDADPSENVRLNEMKIRLFSATTPQDAYLSKTQLEADMYETLPRLGRNVRLPKPFIFNLSNPQEPAHDFSVVFYDNAGEHFEPTRNSADSPGAQHIAAASGIFFLFDPLHNAEFRRRTGEVDDPQLDPERLRQRIEQQDIILAESEVRIKSLLGLEKGQRIATPFAVIVGKSDTWKHLLGTEELAWPVQRGRLDSDAIERNSARVRALLLEVCPAIVANAEAISSEVKYFAASPLGCSPVEFTDSRGIKMIGPDPQHLNPQHAEIPTLWVLSRLAPGMVPPSSNS